MTSVREIEIETETDVQVEVETEIENIEGETGMTGTIEATHEIEEVVQETVHQDEKPPFHLPKDETLRIDGYQETVL